MKDKEKQLFSEWRKKRPKFVEDGIVNEQVYKACSKKVLYILKDVNGGKKDNPDWSLTKFLKTGGRSQTWNNIALWQFGIQTLGQFHDWNELTKLKDNKFRENQLESIAVVNLKKEPGGHTANMNEVWDYAWKDKQFLMKQIAIYNPEIIVCCGTGDIVKEHKLIVNIEKWKISLYGIKFYITHENKIIISYCHPEARIDSNYKYFPLINTLKEITK